MGEPPDRLTSVRHVFVTQDYPPLGGGMARRHVELCRRLAAAPDTMVVSTIAADVAANGTTFDAGEPYVIARQPFTFRGAKTLPNAIRWARWLTHRAQPGDVLHCGNVRPAGYPVWWAHRQRGLPYLVYVYGGDLLRERRKARQSAIKRWWTRRLFSDAAGVVAISTFSADLARDVMTEVGVATLPPIATIDLGTDPVFFSPTRDTGALRRRWNIGDAPLLLTVARLVPHKGQDVALQALPRVITQHPEVRYAIVGEGPDRARLESLAKESGVAHAVIFAGKLSDADIAEAYATATVYVGLSRVEQALDVEGFGISFVEASASGTVVIAGDAGGVRSAVRDGETGIIVNPRDAEAVARTMMTLLADRERRQQMGAAGRQAVETHYNWDRVASETRAFTERVVTPR